MVGAVATNNILDADEALKKSFTDFYEEVRIFLPNVNEEGQKVPSKRLQELIRRDDEKPKMADPFVFQVAKGGVTIAIKTVPDNRYPDST